MERISIVGLRVLKGRRKEKKEKESCRLPFFLSFIKTRCSFISLFRSLSLSFSFSLFLMGPPQAPPRYGRGKVAASASARGANGRGGSRNNTSDDKSKGDDGGDAIAFAAAVAAAQAAAASYDPLAALLGGGAAAAGAAAGAAAAAPSRRTLLLPPAPTAAAAAAAPSAAAAAAPSPLLPPGSLWTARDDSLFVAAAAKYDAFANATNAFIRLIRVRRKKRGRRREREREKEAGNRKGKKLPLFSLETTFFSQPLLLKNLSLSPSSLSFFTNPPKGIHGQARQELARLQRAAALGQAHVGRGRGRFLFLLCFFFLGCSSAAFGGGAFGGVGGVGGGGRSPPAAAAAAAGAAAALRSPLLPND